MLLVAALQDSSRTLCSPGSRLFSPQQTKDSLLRETLADAGTRTTSSAWAEKAESADRERWRKQAEEAEVEGEREDLDHCRVSLVSDGGGAIAGWDGEVDGARYNECVRERTVARERKSASAVQATEAMPPASSPGVSSEWGEGSEELGRAAARVLCESITVAGNVWLAFCIGLITMMIQLRFLDITSVAA